MKTVDLWHHKGPFFTPCTPAGTHCDWLAADSEEQAWENLLEDAAHMPYKTKENFIKRGYTVNKWEGQRRPVTTE